MMKNKMNRILGIVLVLATVFSCAACGAANTGDTAVPGSTAVSGSSPTASVTESGDNTASAGGKDIQLVWATFKGGWADVLEKIFDEYEAAHPNVHVTLYTGESGDFFADLKTLLATDSLPNVFNMRGDNFGAEWAEYLQDVGKSAAVANVKDGFTDSFTWNGTTYGAYYNYEVHGTTWNMDVLKKLGYNTYPTSNAEYMKVLKDMKAAGYTGLAYFGTQQTLYNHLGNAPLVLHGDVRTTYEDIVSGKIDIVNDKYFNEYFDWLAASLPYLNENPISMDQATGTAATYTTDKYAWSILDGTHGLYYGYDTDYTKKWEVGPLCIDDENPYFVLNCQGYVVSNKADDATNAAALDLYNWFYTSDFVAETLTKNFSILTTSKSYKLSEDSLDPFTYKAYQAIQSNDSKPITYYMSSTLCKEYASIEQQFISGALSKKEALTALGEAFRNAE
jgi:ABC-type glycerol-3-phosphate transport system substrate-binding protein